jgi:hypothetical protein
VVSREAQARCKVADNCVRCLHGIGHPPLIALFDDAKGTYAIAEGVTCVARWASTGGRHGKGDLCGDEATVTVAGVDLCPHHADRLQNWRYFEYPEEHVRKKTDRVREADREYEQALDESERHREKALAARSVVYYIRRTSDGAVKIGTSTKFSSRMSQLRSEHGELQVLLTHSGMRAEELAMHHQFHMYRIGRSEWFAPAKELLTWISDRRGMYGEVQPRTWMSKTNLRKLIVAAPAGRDLQWRNGTAVWPPDAVAA